MLRILVAAVAGALLGGLITLRMLSNELMLLRDILRNEKLRAQIETELFNE